MKFQYLLAFLCASFFSSSSVFASTVLIGHFNFDNSSNIGSDTSGFSNNADLTQNVGFTASGIAGGAATFSSASNSFLKWAGATDEIANSVGGDFTFSVWIKTTQTFGLNTDPGYAGVGIIYSDIPSSHNDVIPAALTGNKLAFFTGSSTIDATIHSTSNINTGSFTHIAVTRNLATGADKIYVNGILEASAVFSPGTALNERQEIFVGGNIVDSRYFDGVLDDLQVYNGVLTSSDISFLYNHPGQTATTNSVPTPTTAWLVSLALPGLIGFSRRKFTRQAW